LDLRPDPRFRRQLWTPPSAAPERREQKLMALICPKCKLSFSAPKEYAMAICEADEPPFVGDGRGCGWLLGLEPPYASGSHGRAFAVIDMKIDPATGRHDKQLYVEGWRRIVEHWENRGLAKRETDSEGKVIGIRMPTVADLPSALEQSEN